MTEPENQENLIPLEAIPVQPMPAPAGDDSAQQNVGETIATGLDLAANVGADVVSAGIEVIGEGAVNVLGEAASGCAGCSLVLLVVLLTASAAFAFAW